VRFFADVEVFLDLKFLYDIFGPILHWLYELTKSYGLAIILFSLFSKILTFPLSVSQTKSTKIMKLMAPYQERITKKYGSNNEKSNTELMRLYKNFNYKPWAGCLPLIIQLPILMGLFTVLRLPQQYVFTAEEFASISKSFLWVGDLTKSPSELFAAYGFGASFLVSLIIPIASAVLMFVSQKMTTPSSTSANQNFMMVIMNVMMLWFFYISIQGLGLYWTANSVFGIVQTLILNRFIKVEMPEVIIKKQQERGKKK